MQIPISVLDFSPMRDGETARQALQRSCELAQLAERLGYRRYWFTEHHNFPRIANASPPVVLGHIAAHTRSIRLGSGGILLPNHSPLVIAEQFGTLAALHPGRIDLGIGRASGAPGADAAILQMLRKRPDARDYFMPDLDELLSLLDEGPADDEAPLLPGRGFAIPLWLLGSSSSSAELAGQLGLPFAFATHIAPDMLEAAMRSYHVGFEPVRALARPHGMITAFVIAADTDAQAQDLLEPVRPILIRSFSKTSPAPDETENPEQELPYAVVGSRATVKAGIAAMIEKTKADELMIVTLIRDAAATVRSYEIVADICGGSVAGMATQATPAPNFEDGEVLLP